MKIKQPICKKQLPLSMAHSATKRKAKPKAKPKKEAVKKYSLSEFNELPEMWLPLASVPKGGFFRLTNSDTAPVWVRESYDRSDKKYYCRKYDDYNGEHAWSGTKKVWVGFYF